MKCKNYILYLLFLFCVTYSYAGEEKFSSRIVGADIQTGAVLNTIDDKFYYIQNNPSIWANEFDNHKVANTIRLGFIESALPDITTNTTIVVKLDVSYKDENLNINNLPAIHLEINYNPSAGSAYTEADVFKFTSGHLMRVRVDQILINNVSVSAIPSQSVYLESTISVERFYAFNHLSIANISGANQTNEGYIDLNWDLINGAEEYDIEWLHLDNYTLNNLFSVAGKRIDFTKNSSRISTKNNYCRIPTFFEQGVVFFRVRGISYLSPNYTQRVEGAWSSPDKGEAINYDDYVLVTEHENGNINWQSNINFSENERSNISASYRDGTMRNRQSITKNNTEDVTILTEIYYDFLGRPAIASLPAPTEGYSPIPKYHNSYNKNHSGETFSAYDFDITKAGECDLSTGPMSNLYGASNYYSENNSNKDGQQAYVPNAEEYPFTRIQYMPDNTGRIKKQGAAGVDYQIGSTHETEYFYGQPSQSKLYKLFGTNAGASSNYQLQTMVDANGQISNTYINKNGNVVATSLLGAGPSQLDPVYNLGSATEFDNYNSEWTQEGDDYVSISSSTFFVESTGDHVIEYIMESTGYNDACLPASICFDCVYELQITINGLEECASSSFNHGPVLIEPSSINNYCETFGENVNKTITLEKGSYTITKKLKLITTPIEYYTEQYLENSTCLLTYSDFFSAELTSLDNNCENSICDMIALAELGTKEEYIEENGGGSGDPDKLEADYIREYNQIINTCTTNPGCNVYKQQMLMDVSPGGQYASFDISTFDASGNPLSVFNESNSLPSGLSWKDIPVSNYLDEDGNQATITLNNGNEVPITNSAVTLELLINQWNPLWSLALLELHPEYCYLEFCEDNSSSDIYDYNMLIIDTYDEAVSLGYMNPLNMNSTPVGNSSNLDPFFDGGAGDDEGPLFESYLTDVIDDASVTMDVWEYSMIQAVCPTAQTLADVTNCSYPNYGTSDAECYQDMAWFAFRQMYLDKKQSYYDLVMHQQVNDDADCFNNECIGISGGSCSGLYSEKIPVFPNVNNISNEFEDDFQANLDSECENTCEFVATNWINNLATCGLSGTQLDNLKEDLKAVCKSGCYGGQFDGSSTVNPDDGPISTTYGFASSFQDVIDHYIPVGSQTEDCNSLVLSSPKPFGHNYSGRKNALDECSCTKILTVKDDFDNNINVPTDVSSVYELFEYRYGINLITLERNACQCEDAYEAGSETWNHSAGAINNTWEQIAVDQLVTLGEFVPNDLNCDDCVPCTEVTNEVTNFETEFPFAVGTDNYLFLLGNYLNNKLSFNLTYSEYETFLEICNSGPPSGGGGYNERKSHLTKEFENILNEIIARGYLYESQFKTVNLDSVLTLKKGELNHLQYKQLKNVVSHPDEGISMQISIGTQTQPSENKITIEIVVDSTTQNLKVKDIISVENLRTFFVEGDPENHFIADAKVIVTRAGGKPAIRPITITGITSIQIATEPLLESSNNVEFLCNRPEYPELPQPEDDCLENLIQTAQANATFEYTAYIESQIEDFVTNYKNTCTNASIASNETFSRSFESTEYHYTLYHYDQAGNLVETIPPKGVSLLSTPANVENALLNGNTLLPSHTYRTKHKYNAYNNIVETTSPDAGITNYWYDNFGRLILSRNAQQEIDGKFSYTLYDNRGRIKEVGVALVSVADPETQYTGYSSYEGWITGVVRKEITRMFYDLPITTAVSSLFPNNQQNTRLRVASMAYYTDSYQNTDDGYKFATHYSYDIQGNVKHLIHDIPELDIYNQQYKHISYEYELLSGNVLVVNYQAGEPDAFYHKYCYDKDNRIKEVFSSTDACFWDKDAKYFYYIHGPLARVETGDRKVSAMDYYYTINGWLKGVNSDTRKQWRDGGKDGTKGYLEDFANIHKNIARDAVGYTLSYYKDDYKAIDKNASFTAAINSTPIQTQSGELFNGNISSITTAIQGLGIQGVAYNYDQLNRLKRSRTFNFNAADLNANTWENGIATNDYSVDIDYDANGNITELTRNGASATQIAMDEMTYYYLPNTNKLDYVEDVVPASSAYNDIEPGQTSGNYEYDAIGNLTKDLQEDLKTIEWNVYNKVSKITSTGTNNVNIDDEIIFEYNAAGQRIKKTKRIASTQSKIDTYTTYYLRDAQGNVISVYNSEITNIERDIVFKLSENHLYGSSRLGIVDNNKVLYLKDAGTIQPINFNLNHVSYLLGAKNFEFTNHLGNVLATASDRKNYKEGETVYESSFPPAVNNWHAGTGTNSIYLNSMVELTAQGTGNYEIELQNLNTTAGVTYLVRATTEGAETMEILDGSGGVIAEHTIQQSGIQNFEFTATSNTATLRVRSSYNAPAMKVNDVFIGIEAHYTASIISRNRYYPGGFPMPGRSFNAGSYRYGAAGGQESDSEISGSFGNHYTAENWMYDSRLLRRWNTDPIPVPWESVYAVNRNNPNVFIDPDGAIPKIFQTIGNLFRRPGHKKIYNVATKGWDLNLKWGGLGNAFRKINLGPPAGRMAFHSITTGVWHTGKTLSTSGNPIDRTAGANLFREMVANNGGDSRVTMKGLEIRGIATGGTGFRVTGGLSQASQRSLFASNGVQNVIGQSSFNMMGDENNTTPQGYFEARAGFVPGTNLLPTLFALRDLVSSQSDNPDLVSAAITAGFVAWSGNMFNHKPALTNDVWSLRFSAYGKPGGSVSYQYRYSWSGWVSYEEKARTPLVAAWHRIMWGR